IKTGRTHQIRVQAAHLGHPLLGDDKYGDRDANRAFRKLGLKRLFLHAASIGFEWQDNHKRVYVNAPLDHDLRAVLERLERLISDDTSSSTRKTLSSIQPPTPFAACRPRPPTRD